MSDMSSEIVDDHMQHYGHPKENFQRIAHMWNAYLTSKYGPGPYPIAASHTQITAEDVPHMMILLKQARAMNGYHKDTIDDIGGYAETLHRLNEVAPRDMNWAENPTSEEDK